MSRFRQLAATIALIALGLWLGTVLMTGVAAGVTFPTVKNLQAHAPQYMAYTGEHWRIVAGHVASKIFFISDIVQFACAVLAVGCVGAVFHGSQDTARTAALRSAMLCVTVAMCVSCVYLFIFAPEMTFNLREFWNAAGLGENDLAEKHRAAFDASHPTASTLMAVTALAVFGALASFAWFVAGQPGRSREPVPAGGADA